MSSNYQQVKEFFGIENSSSFSALVNAQIEFIVWSEGVENRRKVKIARIEQSAITNGDMDNVRLMFAMPSGEHTAFTCYPMRRDGIACVLTTRSENTMQDRRVIITSVTGVNGEKLLGLGGDELERSIQRFKENPEYNNVGKRVS